MWFMRTLSRWPQRALAAGVLLAGMTGFLVADDRGNSTTRDQKSQDQKIHDLLRTVINSGADVYNQDVSANDAYTTELNRAGCYRLYQGALIALRPLLDLHPDLQQAIDRGLTEAAKLPSSRQKAFALRAVLDQLRAGLRTASDTTRTETKSNGEKTGGTSIRPPIEASGSKSLWVQLGGEVKVRQVVDDWVAIAGPDPKVNFSVNGKYKLNDTQVAALKDHTVNWISQVTGGPLKYTGQNMRDLHRGMNITNAQYDAAVADLRKALEGRDVPPAAAQDLIKVVEDRRKDIVQPPVSVPEKKTDLKKAASTKPGT
jgi:hemoglobin